jgi:hypothetical protein
MIRRCSSYDDIRLQHCRSLCCPAGCSILLFGDLEHRKIMCSSELHGSHIAAEIRTRDLHWRERFVLLCLIELLCDALLYVLYVVVLGMLLTQPVLKKLPARYKTKTLEDFSRVKPDFEESRRSTIFSEKSAS